MQDNVIYLLKFEKKMLSICSNFTKGSGHALTHGVLHKALQIRAPSEQQTFTHWVRGIKPACTGPWSAKRCSLAASKEAAQLHLSPSSFSLLSSRAVNQKGGGKQHGAVGLPDLSWGVEQSPHAS